MAVNASISLIDAAGIVGGKLEGSPLDGSLLVSGINTLRDAGSDQVSFLSNQRYKDEVQGTQAAAVLVSSSLKLEYPGVLIRVADPYLAFAQLQRHFHPAVTASGQRHASAVIADDVELAGNVDIAAGVIIGEASTIGDGSVIGPGCVIGVGVVIGKQCLLHANVVIQDGCWLGDRVILQPGCVIGSDGFGYAWSGQQHVKIPQVGRVVIEDDVEIGANACVDRGAIGDTIIERGVKLDNLVQIAHNVRIGALTVMASQAGVSGSTAVGKGCQIGGQTGIAGHISIGDGCKLAGKTGVMSSLDAGGTYGGIPAMPQRQWMKVTAILHKLPELWKILNPRG